MLITHDAIAIEEGRRYIERLYVGFSPATNPKPVHIANGLFRTVMKQVANTSALNHFVFVRTETGKEPEGHKLDEVFSDLLARGRIDGSHVTKENLSKLRAMLNKVVNADGAVYNGGMESYSAGFVSFMSRDRVGQDGGEFVAEWLRHQDSPLHGSIRHALEHEEDPISLMCSPLVNTELQDYAPAIDIGEVKFINGPLPDAPAQLWNGLSQASATLSTHLDAHPNKLFRLRLSVLFTSFVLIRHLFSLESQYVPNGAAEVQPFLLDFSGRRDTSSGRASIMTYLTSCQSLSRFYSWAFGEYLRTIRSEEELRREPIPIYKGRTVENGRTSAARKTTADAEEIWRQALVSDQESGQDIFALCGQALYDMMAVEAEGNPIGYASNLGCRIGLMDPPNLSSKRFSGQQDLLEMLVRGAVSPGEVVDLPSLQARLWERYGIIIGGRTDDELTLMQRGVFEADRNSLEDNCNGFAAALGQLNFARLLADGVLQVELEASRAN